LKTTAFVSHSDCALHDPGWGHAEHQGRLPGLVRAVHRDMLTLFEPLLEVEGRHAEPDELELVHSAEYLAEGRRWVEQAARRAQPLPVGSELLVSGASWVASTAAVGSCLRAVEVVLDGQVRNAFCAVRPPARDARRSAPGRFGFLNSLAVTVRLLLGSTPVDRVLVVEWGRVPGPAAELPRGPASRVVRAAAGGSGRAPAQGGTTEAPGEWLRALETGLDSALQAFQPDFVVLSAGFDELAGDPVTGGALRPVDFYHATGLVRRAAESACGGRLVSILEGGYDPGLLGAATVHHLRALASLEPPP
jgi:acetoin utilization deacetylase AcuC-like enzyme